MRLNRGVVFKASVGMAFACVFLFVASCDKSASSGTSPITNAATSVAVQTGNIDDAMKSETSFYAIRGGYDYDRMPIRYPFHLMNVTGEPSLCNGKLILVNNVTAVNFQSGFILGKYGPTRLFGELVQGGWFVTATSSRTNISVSTENEFNQLLVQRGLTNQVLLPVRPLMDAFDNTGVLPFGR